MAAAMNEDYKLNIEKRLSAVESEIKTISTNHLPHLQATTDKILWWIIATLLTLVLTFMGLVVAWR